MDIIAVLRPILFLMLPALSACAPAASTPPEKAFVLADPAKYKTEAERERAQHLTEADCRVKALTVSAAIEKTVASERNSIENVSKAREKGAEMYTAAFTHCMLSNGYVTK